MGTNIRTSIAESNPYYISKHEYLMAKHFVMQYNDWKREKHEIESRIGSGFKMGGVDDGRVSKPVENAQEKAERYSFRINLIEQTAKNSGEDIWEYILLGVTTECNYDFLRLVKGIPCCKDVYYRMYRKFFWLLNYELQRLLDR